MKWVFGALFALCFTGATEGQVLSPQQRALIKAEIEAATDVSFDGDKVLVGTLPPDRLESPVPAALIVEEDPIASGVTNDVAALEVRVVVLELKAPVYDQAVIDSLDWAKNFFNTNATFVSGAVTNWDGNITTNIVTYDKGGVVGIQYIQGP